VHLLEQTLHSYRSTVSVEHEVIVVDNASTDGSRRFLADAHRRGWVDKVLLLPENRGGKAIDGGLDRLSGRYLHVSENDVEYLPGWDTTLLAKFAAFPKLGQLSPFAPEPLRERGEVGPGQRTEPVGDDSARICLASRGVGTTCVVRRDVRDAGLRWRNVRSGGDWRWPDDLAYSKAVKALGYWVAWNDVAVAVSLGHTVGEWSRDPGYYLDGYRHKGWVGESGWQRRLSRAGYRLDLTDGQPRIVPASTPPDPPPPTGTG